jgi:flagellar biosynthesis GTPase FlhF
MDSMKEKRTGVTAYNQGLDSNSLNKTATGVQQIMNASAQRLELVARTFAETGVKDLFILVHRLVRKNYTKPDIIRLRNKWVEVDPRGWKNRKDLTISVGLGSGNKDQQLMHLNSILAFQEKALALGITSPDKIYNALAKLTQNAGFKNPEEFWTNPLENPQAGQQQPDPNQTLIEGQMQIEQMKLQSEATIAQQKAQAQLQQEQLRSQNDVIIEREKIAAQMELERYKAQLKAETDLAIAQIKANTGVMYG